MELYPDAPIYTGIYNPKKLPKNITSRKIIALKGFFIVNFYKYFTFLMPLIFEGFDLHQYDLIVSDGTAWPKSVLTSPDQLHIAYIHTPPRFLYKYSSESAKRNKWYFKPFIALIDHYLRIWDFIAAQRPDYLIANSQEIKRRIEKFYRRGAVVINPPVETTFAGTANVNNLKKPYYIALGRLVAYKNFDVLIQAFNLLDMPLYIVGTGIEENRLKRLANNNIVFTGKVTEQEKHALIEGSLGLINTVADEDFGIVPIEVMSHGKPVLAHKSGGHLEVIEENVSGMFFDCTDFEGLVVKIKEFDNAIRNHKFDSEKIRAGTEKYSKERFQQEFKKFVDQKVGEKMEQHKIA
jgi:glycosyltransferase involved in cell wall biosynthesis